MPGQLLRHFRAGKNRTAKWSSTSIPSFLFHLGVCGLISGYVSVTTSVGDGASPPHACALCCGPPTPRWLSAHVGDHGCPCTAPSQFTLSCAVFIPMWFCLKFDVQHMGASTGFSPAVGMGDGAPAPCNRSPFSLSPGLSFQIQLLASITLEAAEDAHGLGSLPPV